MNQIAKKIPQKPRLEIQMEERGNRNQASYQRRWVQKKPKGFAFVVRKREFLWGLETPVLIQLDESYKGEGW
eukprot:CAMPEP_0201505128 /NCGR_PEP_ID=MMETSP0151_2-20130828/85597_1 /ASSEMBLY_ACC=CAM_ASM_000257 /TAXON_ID=200890 /ORGANISM="Paramoeba atlantica, Strain 621/1 / CCAP 1560/9" /LENGTH=71 /DNA_ID=CAMNT_0047898955 /DNA_START=681 /DNA_END=893 /DNA_ORIENTATION=-